MSCKTINCLNQESPHKAYCGPCWRFIELAAEGEPLEAKRRARVEERALEDAETDRELGA